MHICAWQSADGRVTDHCRVTVQWHFSKKFQIAWNVQKTLFDSWPTVAWPPTTVAWPFSDFFRKNFKLLETSKKRYLTVGQRSSDLRPLSRDHSVTFFKHFPKCLKRSKTLFDSRPTGRTSFNGDAGWWNGQRHNMAVPVWSVTEIGSLSLSVSLSLIHAYMCLTVSRRSRDLRPLSRDRSVTFFKKISNCLKRPKNVVWQSADGRLTSDHCRVTIQWLFSKIFQIAWNIQETLFDGRVTVAWPPTTVAWPLSNGSTYASVCCLSRYSTVVLSKSAMELCNICQWC